MSDPIIVILASYIAGIVIARQLTVPVFICGWGFALGLTAALLGLKRKWFLAALALLFLSAGGWLTQLRIISSEPAGLAPWLSRQVELQGKVISIPVTGRYTRFALRVNRISCAGRSQPLKVKVLVFTREPLSPGWGDEWQVCGALKLPHGYANPGVFDYEAYLQRQGVAALCWAKKLHPVKAGPALHPWRLAQELRDKIYQVLHHNLPAAEAALLRGIVLGDVSGLSPEVQQDFKATGTLHLLAASGMNVGIVAALCFWMFRVFKLPQAYAAAFAMPWVLLYTLMADASASVVRAAFMCLMALLALILKRAPQLLHTLLVAALAMLAVNPLWLHDIGFQLSFMCVLGIFWLSPLLSLRLGNLPRFIREALAITFSSQLMLAPVLAYYFNQLSIIAPLANLILVPPASVLLPCGLLEGLLGSLWLPLSFPFAVINWLLLKFMLVMVQLLGQIPLAWLWVAPPALGFSLSYYAALLAGALWLKNAFKASGYYAALGAGALLAGFLALQVLNPARLLVQFMDIGEGNAVLMQLPHGLTLLLDTGPAGGKNFPVAERVLLPALRARGVNCLDAVIISHWHADHAGGLPFVLRNLKVKALYAPQWDQDNELCRQSTALLEAGHIPRGILTAGMALSCGPDFRLKVLYPPGDKRCETPNAGSLALTLKYKDIAWVLPGDIGREQEEQLPGEGLRAEVLAVAHQGSATSTGDTFLKAVLPRYAVISTSGQRGHPAPETLKRLRRYGVTVLRTDRDGAVTMTTDGVRLQIKLARKAKRD